MIGPLKARLAQKHRTVPYPAKMPFVSDRFRGMPSIDAAKCVADCAACKDACPTDALELRAQKPVLDLGKCLFCAECAAACPEGVFRFTREHRMAARRREQLVYDGSAALEQAAALGAELTRIYGRSFRLREVSAGGCNACEADTNVLGTLVFDLSRFGIQFVASPRHADGLLITGPVTKNMELALRKTYDAVPGPKVVIAVGACAISGGVFAGHEEVVNGASSVVPVDLFVPGCPPHPLTILDGLLRLLGKVR